tara:strand:+ start:794 stop:1054 length:261 start_codon:yes stop_codon:yes gene_type:complete
MGKSKAILFRDPLVEQVVDQFIERSDIGFAKYKVTLDEERKTGTKDLGIYLQDTKEELMDAVLYIQSAQNSLNDLKNKIRDNGSWT